MGSPARDIFEEPNAADAAVVAQVEPMLHATWDIDHVPAFNGDAEDRSVFRMEVKDSSTFHGESHLIFGMRVLLVEFLEHGIEVGGVRMDVDDVGGDIAAGRFDLFDFRCVFAEDIGIGRVLVESPSNLPAFEPDPKRFEKLDDVIVFGQVSILLGDMNGRHEWFRDGLMVVRGVLAPSANPGMFREIQNHDIVPLSVLQESATAERINFLKPIWASWVILLGAMTQKTLTVPSSIPYPARSLGSVLQNLLGIPASHSHWLIENGCVGINHRICRRTGERLEPGDVLEIDWVPMPVVRPRGAKRQPNRSSIEFLYDDPDVCVVVKPAGLLTVPTRYGEARTLVSSVERRLKNSDPKAKVFCVHRLDRDVSGVLVLAKSLKAAEALRDQFAERKPERKYIALVAGVMDPPSGTVTSYLATDADLNRFSVNDPSQGELAITHYATKVVWNDASLVEVRLETGRRNQIRVHLAEANHPILGDPRYRKEMASHTAWPHRRIALHAETLSLTHPTTGESLSFVAPWPQEFRDFQRQAARSSRRRSRPGEENHDD